MLKSLPLLAVSALWYERKRKDNSKKKESNKKKFTKSGRESVREGRMKRNTSSYAGSIIPACYIEVIKKLP